jgi:hypothetical protein
MRSFLMLGLVVVAAAACAEHFPSRARPAEDGGSEADGGEDGGSEAGAPVRDAGPPQPDSGPPLPDAGPPASPCPDGHQPTDPIDYGTCEVTRALADTRSAAVVHIVLASDSLGAQALQTSGVTLDARAESYAVVAASGATVVIGRDAVGAMYGALEVAERLRDDGPASIPPVAPVTGAPATAIRGANLFLALPGGSETTATWWFRDPSFWTAYLDMMANARLDFLDLHGMFDLKTTLFPNALLYFGTSSTQPGVGIAAADRAANVAALQQIVATAAVRGIRVGLMSYRADTSPLADNTGPVLSSADLETYTREAVADIATRVPKLANLGFRIGESGQTAAWYAATFVAGLKQAGTGAKMHTRTWLAPKADVLALAAAVGDGMIAEVKYNGEHFATPYPVEGASFATFASYSYQAFLTPPAPYSFVWQIRAGGTHRMFRFADFERARRAALSLSMSPRVAGVTVEAGHAFLPPRDFYHAAADVFSPWTFRRDELTYLLLGRLAYDATTPESRFRAMLAARVGNDGLWDALQAAGDVAPWIQTALTCGPDQRDYAPELELGGDVAWWASPAGGNGTCSHHIAFDGFSVAMPAEAADDLVAGVATTRITPAFVAQALLADASRARAASQVTIDPGNAEARDVVRECVAVADLAEWFAHKLRGATALAVYERTAVADFLTAARSETALGVAAFQKLATDTSYIAPFEEPMRMGRLGYSPFHWAQEVPLLANDATSIDATVQQVTQHPPPFGGSLPVALTWLDTPRAPPPTLASLVVTPADPAAPAWTVNVTLGTSPPAGVTVRVLWKPFDSETDWKAVTATGSGTAWSASVPGTGAGGAFAVEIAGSPGQGWRLPNVMQEMPYRVLAP